MIVAFVIVLLYVLIAMFELAPLFSEKRVKWIVIYGILMTSSLVLSVMLQMGVNVPSPMDPIASAVVAVRQLLGGGK